jgi:hypothetical protein
MISKIEFDFGANETPIGLELIVNGEKWRGYFTEAETEKMDYITEKNGFGVIAVNSFNQLKS